MVITMVSVLITSVHIFSPGPPSVIIFTKRCYSTCHILQLPTALRGDGGHESLAMAWQLLRLEACPGAPGSLLGGAQRI